MGEGAVEPFVSKVPWLLRPTQERAWKNLPRSIRLGIWGAGTLLLIHVVVAIRIWYGLQEPAEIGLLRGGRVDIEVPVIAGNIQDPWLWGRRAVIGLRGISPGDVTVIRLRERATDRLVRHIAQHFPNLEELSVTGGDVTTEALLALRNCPRLEVLDASETDVDDGLKALLPHLPSLWSLNVSYTNVTDEFARVAAEVASLKSCDVVGTDLSSDAVAKWRVAQPGAKIVASVRPVAVRAVIRWSDGTISRSFNGAFELEIVRSENQEVSGRSRTRSVERSTGRLMGSRLEVTKEEVSDADASGEFQMRLALADIVSAPARFSLKDRVVTSNRPELRMPVTREEALRRRSLSYEFSREPLLHAIP